MKKITIIGSGAIGGTIGAFLARSGDSVDFVDVNDSHISKMKSDGLSIVGEKENFRVENFEAMTLDELLNNKLDLDIVLLCVKIQHTKDVINKIKPLLNKSSYVVSFQNGLSELEISEQIGRERVVGGFVNIFADYLKPGVIHFGGAGTLSIGELNGEKTDRIKKLKKRLSAYSNIQVTDNIIGVLWGKIAYGSNLAVTALTNETIVDIFKNKSYRKVLVNVALEVKNVAEKIGVRMEEIDKWDPNLISSSYNKNGTEINKMYENHINIIKTYTKTRTGIWRDLAVRKRKSEKKYQYAPVLRLAEENNIKMPLTLKLLSMIKEIEDGERKFSIENIEELRSMVNIV